MRRLGALALAVLVGLGGVVVLPATAAGAAEGDASHTCGVRTDGYTVCWGRMKVLIGTPE